MKQMMKQIAIVLCVATTLAGCASVQPVGPDDNEQEKIEASSRTKNTILAIGGFLLLTAIIVNESADGARDAAER